MMQALKPRKMRDKRPIMPGGVDLHPDRQCGRNRGGFERSRASEDGVSGIHNLTRYCPPTPNNPVGRGGVAPEQLSTEQVLPVGDLPDNACVIPAMVVLSKVFG
jgi:hypothetical protein